MTEQPQAGPEGNPPITVKDVLRAIFLPQREAEPLALPPLSLGWKPWSRRPAEGKTMPPDLIPLLARPSVDYVDEPVTEGQAAGVARTLALALGTVTTFLITYLAQTALIAQGRAAAGGGLFALAGLAWLVLIAFDFAQSGGALLKRGPRVTGSAGYPLPQQTQLAPLSERGIALIIAVPLSATAYLLSAGNTFTPAGVVAWVVSVAAWLVVAAERNPAELASGWAGWLSAVPGRLRQALRPRWLPLAAFVLILGAAAFFRFYRLDAVPVEMTSDHVEKLLDAYDVSQGIHRVFFTHNGGREAIQFYLVALAAKVFGTGMSFLTLKLVSALEGLAVVPLMILLGRELVDRETGYLAAALVAVSWWDVVLSRLALRIVLTPLVFTLLLFVLARGIRTGSRRAWLWAGVWMGVGVYAYQAFRIVPLVAVAAWAMAIAGPVVRAVVAHSQERPDAPARREIAANVLGRQTVNLALAGLIALAIFVPMLRVWRDYPHELWNRVVNRTTESERAIEGEPLAVFADNYGKALRMFNVRGDVSWISAVPGKPMLDRVAGGLLVLGALAWAARIVLRRDPVDVFLIAAGLVMLLPSALAIAFPIENPSATRASGTLPIVFLLAAWPLALIRQRWTAALGGWPGRALSGALVAVMLGGSALYSFDTVFREYDQSYRGAALNPGEVASAVREVVGPDAPLDGVWLIGWPHWHDFRAIGIEAGEITFRNAIVDSGVLREYLEQLPERFGARPLVFIVHPEDEETLSLLRAHFPGGRADRYQAAQPGRDFILVVVPGEQQ